MADDQHDDQDAPVEIELTANELNQGLLASSKLGKVTLVLQTLQKGADISTIDNRVPGNWTALHFAAYYGHYRVVDVLLRNGAANKYREYIESVANDPYAPRVRCYNSPLSWAVIRGHLRCVWLLLNAGYSPMDVDTNGNNCLHLAAACLAPNPLVQLEMIKTIMYQGCDPDVRNWLGQRAIDMLTKKNSTNNEAIRLLSVAANTTKCASSGTTFGADQLRYLCYSTNKFFCEEASVEKKIPAFALAKPGVTVHDTTQDDDSTVTGSNIADTESIKKLNQKKYKDIELVHYGIAQGIGQVPVTTYNADLRLVRPVRYGAEISYRIADAEANLENVLNPFPDVVQKALEKAGYIVSGSALNTSAVTTDESTPNNHASTTNNLSYDFELELYITSENIQALENAVSQVRELRGDVQLVARGMAALTRLRAANQLRESVTSMMKKRPLEDAILTDNLSTAIEAAKHSGVGETLLRQAELALRVGLAEIELIGATVVCNAITVGTHMYDADIGRLQNAIHTAIKASTEAVRVESGDDIFEEPVEEKPATGNGKETDGDNNTTDANKGNTEGSTEEPSNPDSATTETGEEQSASSNTETAAISGNETKDGAPSSSEEANPTTTDDASSSSSSSSSSSEEGVSATDDTTTVSSSSAAVSNRITRPRLDIPVLASNIIHLSPVHNTVMETGNALLSRLVCEVKVTDSIGIAENSFTKVTEVVERHKEEDPTLLPVPEIPVVPEAVPSSRPPSGKGGKAPAPAPAPADATPPVAAPPDPAFPCDSAGVPLPDSPQLIAIKVLRDACTNLDTIIQESRTAGADAACIANAENSLNRLRNELMTSLQTETTRVEFYRAERAKLEKKNKKKKK